MASLARKRTSTSVQILNVAQELAQTRGFNAFSYADIAEVVGIRKASIHYHFPTKAHLGKALIQRYRESMQQSLAQIREEKAAPRDRLTALVGVYEGMLASQRLCLCAMLGAGIMTTPPEFREGVTAFFTDMATWIAEVIKDGCVTGAFVCESPEESAWTMLNGMLGAQIIARACQWEVEQFQTVVVETFIAPLQA